MADRIGTLRNTRGRVYIEWEIKNCIHTIEEKFEIDSPPFVLSDCSWCLRLGWNSDNLYTRACKWISLYLVKKNSKAKKHVVDVRMGIRKSDGSVYKCGKHIREFTKLPHGWPKFTKLTRLLESKESVLQNDTLKVFCEAHMMLNSIHEKDTETVLLEGSKTLIEHLTMLYQKRHLSDVLIRVKDKEFQAHRFILSARSPVFASMFEQDEKKTDVGTFDCDPNSFEEFLLYLYTGNMDVVSSENVFGLYVTANMFGMEELRAKCAQYVACHLSVDSFCDSARITAEHVETELLESVKKFFYKNVDAILPTAGWQTLLEVHPTFCDELLMNMVGTQFLSP